MHISHETAEKSDFRLRGVITTADLRWEPGHWFFQEFQSDDVAEHLRADALALVRGGDGWSQLVTVGPGDAPSERMAVWSFHFPVGTDNSGFIGWLANQIKRATGSGVLVICGYNSQRSGVFDYWACPISVERQVRRLLRELAAGVATPPRDTPQLDGVRMRAVKTGCGGVVNTDTILQFSQLGECICGRYEGGTILLGYLVGRMIAGQLEFRFSQLGHDGSLDAGYSRCDLEQLDDGRMRLIENFLWQSREGTGVNVFEEIPPDPAPI